MRIPGASFDLQRAPVGFSGAESNGLKWGISDGRSRRDGPGDGARRTFETGSSVRPSVRAAGFAEVYGDYGEIAITSAGKSIAAWGEGTSYDGPGGVWVNRQP
jgi:hypothetical protein